MDLEESYRVLNLTPGATLHEVKRSYRELLKFFHPDRHQASPGLLRKATEETKKINLAYELLCKFVAVAQPKRESSRSKRSGPAPIAGQPVIVPACGATLNWVVPGRFRMGSPAGEGGRSNDEGPQTEVTISRGFWLGIFAVTQEEWKAIAEEINGLKAEPSFFRGERRPVEQVSWEDCQQWLNELNALEQDRLPGGYKYRLPTEAEWEFVCRAGSAWRFCFGDSDAQLSEYAWYSANATGHTHPVGEKTPNGGGFFDMHGNVWEWCHDRYGGPLSGGNVRDPKGPMGGTNRVIRGGSWGMPAARCRSAYRVWNKPGYRDYTLGFRLALAPALPR